MKRLVLFPEYVTGFTIKDVEDAVIDADTMNDWAQNIVTMYPYNLTAPYVAELFSLW